MSLARRKHEPEPYNSITGRNMMSMRTLKKKTAVVRTQSEAEKRLESEERSDVRS